MESGRTGLRVLMAASEIAPFARTGGLGDILASLPAALQGLGVKVSLVMPAYRSVLQGGFPLTDTGVRLAVPVPGQQEAGTLLKIKADGDVDIYLVRADRYYDRDYLYGTPGGDYPDNAERFIFFCRAALEVARLDPPQVFHAHDWQSATAITLLKTRPHLFPELAAAKAVLTMHNPGYQGLFPPSVWPLLGLDRGYFNMHQLEFYGKINLLKGGIVFADAVTTVSPTYAEEIKTAEQGFGLDGVFRERAEHLSGILNGADYELWNPETDPHLPRQYSAADPAGKGVGKAGLQRAFLLPQDPDVPVIAMVTRLSAQKGIDLLLAALEDFLTLDIQFVLLGTGEAYYHNRLRKLHRRYPRQAGVRIAFDDPLAHQVVAGADMLLIPSRYEPCGLTQMYALRYGTIPIVRAVGGLKDTVSKFEPATGRGNGVVFDKYEAGDLLAAVRRALALYRRREHWAALMANAMATDLSWKHSAREYAKLYQRLAG